MASNLIPINPALLALMHGAFREDGSLMPFAREIMLLECHIAGTTHREIKHIEPTLGDGAFLQLKREPGNPHDALAIMIYSEGGHHLGYVPRSKNEALARLMDAGKILFGRMNSKEWQGEWLKIEMQILMRDF